MPARRWSAPQRLLTSERAARRQAGAANQAKDLFAAMVSHELRTPMTAVMSWVLTLRTGRLEPEQATRALAAIEQNVRLQARLIDDLTDVSRILVGKLSLDLRRLELAVVVEAAVETCRPAAESKGVHLRMAPAPLAVPVRGDAARLQQVVSNLVGNAIKFTPAGGNVGVSVERAGKSARIRVTDTGEGIKPEALPHIFERFWQAHRGQADPTAGFGLGLAIVRQLVELHAGTVDAQSDGPGRGARFTVELPEYDVLLKR